MTWWKVQKCFKDRDYFKIFSSSCLHWLPESSDTLRSPRFLLYFSPGGFAGSLFTLGDPPKIRERGLFGNEKSFLQKKKVASGLKVFHFLNISSRNNPTKNRWIIHQVFEHLFKSTSRLHNAFATAHIDRAFVASTEWVAWFRTVDLGKTINPKHTSFLGQTWNMS